MRGNFTPMMPSSVHEQPGVQRALAHVGLHLSKMPPPQDAPRHMDSTGSNRPDPYVRHVTRNTARVAAFFEKCHGEMPEQDSRRHLILQSPMFSHPYFVNETGARFVALFVIIISVTAVLHSDKPIGGYLMMFNALDFLLRIVFGATGSLCGR
jgi:hypothetical protein